MYLKSLEMIGFKSFSDKTKLLFEPGMTCIVGPNGCGKSNVGDAVRWVIGEQSAKALRGSKMQDCIFNGTDHRKPLGMAEVSITFADCEGTLQTEYNEVTITRRVFRDGQGAYFVNKTPCRLKDIQRLFMDTGVGTTSYSIMEQGRIDRVLSARPEDRRAIFEEASGITKFKADKKESIRKLEHTEANLLRLSDVIREVKRQIGSLQRQAGKAKRYKTFREELRGLDMFITRDRLKDTDAQLKRMEQELTTLANRDSAGHQNIEDLEKRATSVRAIIGETEQEIGEVLEQSVHARSKLDNTRQNIESNRNRITEYRLWEQRDTQEIDQNRRVLEEQTAHAAKTAARLSDIRTKHDTAKAALDESNATFATHQKLIDDARTRIQRLREESVELEGVLSRMQNEQVDIESRSRQSVLQRERLATEKGQLARTAESYTAQQGDMTFGLARLNDDVDKGSAELRTMEDQLRAQNDELRRVRQTCNELQSKCSAKQAQIDLLNEQDAVPEDSAEGTKLLLDADNPLDVDRSNLLGALAQNIEVEEPYRVALEAVLSRHLEDVLFSDRTAALDALAKLEEQRRGSGTIRFASSAAEAATPEGPGEPLLSHVTCAQAAARILTPLVSRVRIIDSLQDCPNPLPQGLILATRGGSVVHDSGLLQFKMPDTSSASPLRRKNLVKETKTELEDISGQLEKYRLTLNALTEGIEALEQKISATRSALDEKKRLLAQREGEHQVLTREVKQAKERLETVSWELQELTSKEQVHDDQKKELAQKVVELRQQRDDMSLSIREQTTELTTLESRHMELQAGLTDRRVEFAGYAQEIRHVESEHTSASQRVQELESAIHGRSEGIQSYKESIDRLTHEIETAEQQLSTLEKNVSETEQKTGQLRGRREEQQQRLKQTDTELHNAREQHETLRERISKLEVQRAEDKMRRQNQIERVTSEHNITIDDLIEAPDPEWKDGQPSMDSIETTIAEVRTRLEAMGPVNLVAIEEYNELEERYSFLSEQEHDLVQAKDQLMELIRKINRTTSEMFRSTFDQVNINFQEMFQTLFNGGTAKLVLVNEEDVLDCGIEIIARPPGKRLQNVSLLSGGERTMTAVALLFAIYMIKPSPFCLLDELDAALDDANISRFVTILEGFLSQSQFIVVTHNRQTIAAAATVYGITMPEKGISKVVSMKFKDHETATDQELIEA